MKDHRIKSSVHQIAKSLQGDYREEQLFVLKQAVELHDFYREMIKECDRVILSHMEKFQPKIDLEENPLPPSKSSHKKPQRNEPTVDWRTALYTMTGVDLTSIPGINASIAETIISEIGLDMSAWTTEKKFSAWLGLSPQNRISGGKILSRSSRKFINRAAQALRMAANSLTNSKSALGAFLRRLRFRLGPAKAIAATAHKLARIPAQQLDLLIVDELGKNISGTGMDLNVIGSWRVKGGKPDPDFRRIVTLSLTRESLGNGLGIELADFTTERVMKEYDPAVTYVNLLTASEPGGNTREGPLPLALPSDREAIEVALHSALPGEAPRVCRIRNTALLEELWVSEPVLKELRDKTDITVLQEPEEVRFDKDGNLF